MGVDICDTCMERVGSLLSDKAGASVRANDPNWMKEFAKHLKEEDAEYVRSVAEVTPPLAEIPTSDRGETPIPNKPESDFDDTPEVLVMATKKKVTKKKAATKKKTTKKKTTKKSAAKTTRKKAKKIESGDADKAHFKRRAIAIDDVGGSLLKCDTVEQMIGLADAAGVENAKLASVLEAFEGGAQAGLIRMRLGNLMRGAIRRAERTK